MRHFCFAQLCSFVLMHISRVLFYVTRKIRKSYKYKVTEKKMKTGYLALN